MYKLIKQILLFISIMSNIYDNALSIVLIFGLTILPFFVFMKPIIFINNRFLCKKQKKSVKKIVKKPNEKIKIGVLTNELPPIIYGGVSTWVLNFMKMFEEDPRYESIPIFLAYQDDAPDDFPEKYPGIRIIRNENEVYDAFKDIDICVNNLWIALNTIKHIKALFPDMPLLSVCHSLIKMEHLTNLGSVYTNNYFEQEITFEHSDFVILISKAEKKYYTKFGYSNYKATPVVIYNMYCPKFDNEQVFKNYDNDNLGYIGRHVPRKRPELTLMSMLEMNIPNTKVINMGVKFDGKDCYWKKMMKKYTDELEVIEFTCDKAKKQEFYDSIGGNVCSGIYEPFGYTVCETLDRRIPLIVGDIDGPSEIVEAVKKYVYTYDVDKLDIEKDKQNLVGTLEKYYKLTPEEKKLNAEMARKCLDRFRPENIKTDWVKLFETFQ